MTYIVILMSLQTFSSINYGKIDRPPSFLRSTVSNTIAAALFHTKTYPYLDGHLLFGFGARAMC